MNYFVTFECCLFTSADYSCFLKKTMKMWKSCTVRDEVDQSRDFELFFHNKNIRWNYEVLLLLLLLSNSNDKWEWIMGNWD